MQIIQYFYLTLFALISHNSHIFCYDLVEIDPNEFKLFYGTQKILFDQNLDGGNESSADTILSDCSDNENFLFGRKIEMWGFLDTLLISGSKNKTITIPKGAIKLLTSSCLPGDPNSHIIDRIRKITRNVFLYYENCDDINFSIVKNGRVIEISQVAGFYIRGYTSKTRKYCESEKTSCLTRFKVSISILGGRYSENPNPKITFCSSSKVEMSFYFANNHVSINMKANKDMKHSLCFLKNIYKQIDQKEAIQSLTYNSKK